MLRLKEKPSEWTKFTAVMSLTLNIPFWLLWWNEFIPLAVAITTGCIGIFATLLACIVPRWFRGFYRGGMTLSFHIGQLFGKVLLTLFFFLLVTPLGLLLRLLRKDLLRLKTGEKEETYWHSSKTNNEFDRMF